MAVEMGLRGSFLMRVVCDLLEWSASAFRLGCLRLGLGLGFGVGLMVCDDRVDWSFAGDWVELLLCGGAMVSLQMLGGGVLLVRFEGRSRSERSGSKSAGEAVGSTYGSSSSGACKGSGGEEVRCVVGDCERGT